MQTRSQKIFGQNPYKKQKIDYIEQKDVQNIQVIKKTMDGDNTYTLDVLVLPWNKVNIPINTIKVWEVDGKKTLRVGYTYPMVQVKDIKDMNNITSSTEWIWKCELIENDKVELFEIYKLFNQCFFKEVCELINDCYYQIC